jgi:HD-like signal output (HDOD) protein
MKRVLFVDDEPRILEGLQRMLRPQRSVWEMNFAASGEEALALMDAAPYDIVVSDMKMPRMDGAMLLEIVREKYPMSLRIVLSGYTELEASYRAVPVAHQFLLKPCEADKLRIAIERGTLLIDLLANKALATTIGSLQELPSAPQTYMQLRAEMGSEEPSIKRIVGIIEKDVAIAAKVLQLVNSAFFGIPREVTDIQTAVTLIGSNILHHLVLSIETFRAFHSSRAIPGFSLDAFDAHSQLSARIASVLVQKENLPKGLVIAALLHDIGKLVIAERAPDHLAQALEVSRRENQPLYAAEERLFGVSHAEVGAYLLGLWGLPFPIIEAVAHHHRPERANSEKMDLVVGVFIADQLAKHLESPNDNSSVLEITEPDLRLLESLHLAEKFPEWQLMAQELAQQPQWVKS